MSDILLDIIPKDGNFYFDSFGEALVYALIGFLVVFCGIVLIIFIIWLLGLILRKTNNLEFLNKFFLKVKASFGKLSKKTKDAPKSDTVQVSEQEDVPDEIKAAVIAAVMAYYSAEKPECEFKVKRIKRI